MESCNNGIVLAGGRVSIAYVSKWRIIESILTSWHNRIVRNRIRSRYSTPKSTERKRNQSASKCFIKIRRGCWWPLKPLCVIHSFIEKRRLILSYKIALHTCQVVLKLGRWLAWVVLNICSIWSLLCLTFIFRSILVICCDDRLVIIVLAERVSCCYKLWVEFNVVHRYFLPCVGSAVSNWKTRRSLGRVYEIGTWFPYV
jgi:hypothetical protein